MIKSIHFYKGIAERAAELLKRFNANGARAKKITFNEMTNQAMAEYLAKHEGAKND